MACVAAENLLGGVTCIAEERSRGDLAAVPVGAGDRSLEALRRVTRCAGSAVSHVEEVVVGPGQAFDIAVCRFCIGGDDCGAGAVSAVAEAVAVVALGTRYDILCLGESLPRDQHAGAVVVLPVADVNYTGASKKPISRADEEFVSQSSIRR